jgi:hypothetical protein
MWDAEKDDDASFERRLDSVVREIGDRGKVQVSEAVPPVAAASRATAPAPAPASAPAPAASPKATSPALAPAPTLLPTLSSIDPRDGELATTRDLSYAPSLPQHEVARPPLAPAAGRGGEALTGSLEAMAALLERQHDIIEARMDKQQDKMDAKLEQLQTKMQAEALKARELASAMSCVSEGQLELLQTRLDALHQAKLLTEDEIGALEDCVADYIDCRSSLNPAAAEIGMAAEKVKKMVGLSEAVGKDGMLARQLRRKFVL